MAAVVSVENLEELAGRSFNCGDFVVWRDNDGRTGWAVGEIQRAVTTGYANLKCILNPIGTFPSRARASQMATLLAERHGLNNPTDSPVVLVVVKRGLATVYTNRPDAATRILYVDALAEFKSDELLPLDEAFQGLVQEAGVNWPIDSPANLPEAL